MCTDLKIGRFDGDRSSIYTILFPSLTDVLVSKSSVSFYAIQTTVRNLNISPDYLNDALLERRECLKSRSR